MESNNLAVAFKIRKSKGVRIKALFAENIGKHFNSNQLHATFGSGFRSRVSEINRDPLSPFRIVNHTIPDGYRMGERSEYWSELKPVEVAA
jgi:hypothetical protein